jgi:hypothetical protein
MKRTIAVFFISTIVLFAMFSEILAIKKEAAFAWWANDYIQKYGKNKYHSEEEIKKEASEYSDSEISREFAYHAIKLAIYESLNLGNAIKYLQEKKHRRIPLIGLLDVYSNLYSSTFFERAFVESFARSSQEVVGLEANIENTLEQNGLLENVKKREWWNEFAKSDNFLDFIEKHFEKINSFEQKSIDKLYKENIEIENPNTNPLSPTGIVLNSCIDDYIILNERTYSNYQGNFNTRDLVKATVDAETIVALNMGSEDLKLGVINPNYSKYSSFWGLPRIYAMLIPDIVILLLLSVFVSLVLIRTVKKVFISILVSAIAGGVLSYFSYTLFFAWCFIGGAIGTFKSNIYGEKDVVTIGIKTGILIFLINSLIFLAMSLFGMNLEESILCKFGLKWALLLITFLDLLIIPILYVIFSILGAFIGKALKKPSPY